MPNQGVPPTMSDTANNKNTELIHFVIEQDVQHENSHLDQAQANGRLTDFIFKNKLISGGTRAVGP